MQQLVKIPRETGPEARHLDSAVGARRSEGIVLARMPEPGFHPFGFDETRALEASQQRINGSLGDDHARAVFHPPKHFEAIQPAGPEAGESCQLDASFAQLDFPLAGCIVVSMVRCRTGDHLMTVR